MQQWAWPKVWARSCSVNMPESCIFLCLKCIIVLLLAINVLGWNNEDLELFDLVEEVNQNFYDVLGVTPVRGGR